MPRRPTLVIHVGAEAPRGGRAPGLTRGLARATLRRVVRGVAAAGAFAAASASARAWALDAEVASDTALQSYDMRSPTGETILERRRLTTTLGVSGYDLLSSRPGDLRAPELTLRIRLRYDADYGASSNTTDTANAGALVPGFALQRVDLMYGYIEGRRFLKGWLGFRLGRQYVTDVLGWWSFDGGELALTTPYFVKAEIYGGLEQRGGLPLSTSRFEADGVWRGDRNGYDTLLYPAFQPAAVAPAFGAALESTGATWIHGRLTYRRVYNTGASNVTEFTGGLYSPQSYTGTRVSSERIGYAVDANVSSIGGAKGGIVYDLYRAAVTSAYGSVDVYAGQKVTLSADYDYYVPSFDGDSIWNFFAGEPRNDVGVRATADVDRRLSLAGSAHLRVFTVATGPFAPGGGGAYSPSPDFASGYYPRSAHTFDEGGNLSVRWRTGETRLAAHGSADFGNEGDRVGGDVSGEHVIETRYVVGARAGAWQWKDDLRVNRETTSFQYVLTAGYRFLPQCHGSVEWEHDINTLVGQRFRVLFLLSLGTGR